MDESKPKTADINCPFLKRANPSTTSGFCKFVSDVSAAGMQYPMALFVTLDNTVKQKGARAALTGQVPDLYALNQVAGVSHPDKYLRHMDETKKGLAAAKNEQGEVTLQDLVDIKKKIALEQEKETIGSVKDILESSRIETCIMFVGCGGNLETGKVLVSDVLTFLEGKTPANQTEVTISTMNKAKAMAKWGDE